MRDKTFRKLVWEYYKKEGRRLPWRPPSLRVRKDGTLNPYRVFISEVMLQQTQVSRVLGKYPEFTQAFPTFKQLAAASKADVLAMWQGLGYNRRALHLREAAQTVTTKHGGKLPRDIATLRTLPGIGEATAGSLAAFVFNDPVVFIETNVRRVYIHHFFSERSGVSDAELEPIVRRTLDKRNPRQWYYALMDYGSALAKTVPNPNRRSVHHSTQSRFEGSDRQIRGRVLRELTRNTSPTMHELRRATNASGARFAKIIKELEKEGFVQKQGDILRLSR